MSPPASIQVSDSDLPEQLQATLGQSYTIERELGGGGMSRVFLARDTSLGRRVVVKVLPPELGAGVNTERFRREIQLAASLQHPHIVPLLSAGQGNDLTYYTMPFIEGESLRARLARGVELPVSDVLAVLRDVAKALAHAHRRGVVHRDIKPENILLSEGDSLVADFGVAKALSASTVSGMLTSVGIALGTPTYMSPEQAAGDPDTDHRADIYALGVLGYELLTGTPPFSGRPPRELLAAHALEAPENITLKRSGIPDALADLIMCCLEKRPADRPQSAEQVLEVLEQIATSGTISRATRVRRRPRVGIVIAAAVAVVVAVTAALLVRRPLSAGNLDANLIVVSPFRVFGADPAMSYLREGMLDLLAAKLTGEGGPRAMDPRTVLSAWRRAGGSEREDVAGESMLRTAAGLGAGQLLLGGIVGFPGRLSITASVLSVPSGSVRAQASVEGPQDSLAVLVDRLTAQLLAMGAGEQGHRLSKLTSTSLPALRAYLDGQAAYRRGRYHEAVDHLRIAVQHDSTFVLAAMSLAAAAQWTFEWPLRQRAVAMAWSARSRLSDADLAQLLAQSGRSFPRTESWAEYIALADSAVLAAPDRADRWFVLGDVLFHFGAAAALEAPHERAHAAFERALALDSSFAAPLEHLVELATLENDTAQVRRYSELYLAYHPSADIAEFIRWRAAHFLGDAATLAAMREGIRDLGSHSLTRIVGIAQMTGLGLDDAELAARELLRRAGSAEERQQAVTRLGQLLVNRGRLVEGWHLFNTGGTLQQTELQLGVVVATLMYGVESLPTDQAAAQLARFADRPPSAGVDRLAQYRALCWVARWHLSKGDTTVASVAARRLPQLGAATEEAPDGPVPLGQPPLCALLLQAEIAVAAERADASAVVQRVDSVMRTGPTGPDVEAMNLVLSRLFERIGARDEALGAARRRFYNWDEGSLWYLPQYLRQEGRLAVMAGDRAGAARTYRHYLALHANPDPALLGHAAEIRAELARLEAR